MTTSLEAFNHWITTGKAIAVTNTNPNNVHVLIHRYDHDNFAVQELELRDSWSRPGNLHWAVKSVHGVFRRANAQAILGAAGLSRFVFADDPAVPEELRSYIARCVIPIEWQRDFLTDPHRESMRRVRIYLPARVQLAFGLVGASNA